MILRLHEKNNLNMRMQERNVGGKWGNSPSPLPKVIGFENGPISEG